MKLLKQLLVAGLLGLSAAKDGDGLIRGSGAPKDKNLLGGRSGDIGQDASQPLDPNPVHDVHPPSYLGRDEHDRDTMAEPPKPPKTIPNRGEGAHLERDPNPNKILPPGHEARMEGRRRPKDLNRRKYKKGDGSLASHKYDYLVDELEDLREELADTEDTFGHNSDEAHLIMSKVRHYEQIRRHAKMLDFGMPQDEFDELVELMEQVAELRAQEQLNGPGSIRSKRRFEDSGREHPDPEDTESEGYGEGGEDMLTADEQAVRRERNKKIQALNKKVRSIREHYRVLPKPMTHEASAEEHAEIMEVYNAIPKSGSKQERNDLKAKLQHLQTKIHDKRRHKDMSDEDRARIKELRDLVFNEEDPEAKRDMEEEIEQLYRSHRQEVRAKRGRGHEGRGADMKPRKNYVDEDDELKQLHEELHKVDTRDERKAIRKKIRERLTVLRENDPDTPDAEKFRPGGFRNHGPLDPGPPTIRAADVNERHNRRPGRRRPEEGPEPDAHPVGGRMKAE